MSERTVDVLIVGGGLVGASLACALGRSRLKVTLVEAVAPEAPAQPSYDDRTTALAPSTQRAFAAMGLWDDIAPDATPIREIHVSERGRFGFVRMSAREERLEALGFVVANRRLGEVLPKRAGGCAEMVCPATVQDLQVNEDAAVVTLAPSGERIQARLLVVADGARSRTREMIGVEADCRDYGQVAVIANLTFQRDHGGRAFERFTPEGPLAVLPTAGGRCALIWSVPQEQAPEVLALDDAAFAQEVQQRFGWRLGRLLKAGARVGYPLAVTTARRFTAQRAVIIGNAAHSLHPVAGQGFNLAIRDVAALAELLHGAAARGEDVGTDALLRQYEQARLGDYRRVGGFTDLLVRVFSNAVPGLVQARNVGLLALDLFPAGKRGFLRYAMGRSGPLPRLSRGVPLAEGS